MSVTGAVISVSIVPDRFSSAKSRIVNTGTTINIAIQKKMELNSSFMIVTPAGPEAITLTSRLKLTPMTRRKNIIITYAMGDKK